MTPKEMDELTKKRDAFEAWITDNGNYPHLAHKTQHGMYLNEHAIHSWEGFRKGYDIGITNSIAENSKLRLVLKMVVDDIKAPDDLLKKGAARNFTAIQQFGIIKARKLLED